MNSDLIQRIEAYFAMTDGDSNGCYVDPVSRKLLREALAALKETEERLRKFESIDYEPDRVIDPVAAEAIRSDVTEARRIVEQRWSSSDGNGKSYP